MPELISQLLNDDALHAAVLDKLNGYREKIGEFDRRSGQRDKMRQYYQLYKSYPDIYRTKEKYQSNIFVPLTYQFVSTIHPRLTNAVYSVYPLFEMAGETARAYDRTENSQVILNSMLYHNDFYTNFDDTLLFALIFGTGVMKYVVARKGFTRVFPEWCDPMSIGVDPNAADYENAKYCYQDFYKPIWHLLAREKEDIYHGIERITKDNEMSSNSVTPANERLASIGMAPKDFQTDDYKVTEYYCIIENPLVSQDYQNMLFTVVNDKYIIRAEKNPYGIFPYERVAPLHVPGEFYGMSVPQIIQYLQYEQNEKRNQLLDASKLAVNPIWTVVQNSILGAYRNQDIPMEPGTMIDVAMEGAINPLQFNFQSLMAGMEDLKLNRQDMNDALGVFDYNRGAPRPGEQTATEIVSLINEGNMRFLKMIMNIEHHSLRRIGKTVLRLYKENMMPTESVRIVEPKDREGILMHENGGFVSVSKEDIDFDYEMRCMASSAYNMRAIDRQFIMELSAQLAQDPNMVGKYDNVQLYKMMARAMNVRDLSFFIPAEKRVENLPDNIAPEVMMGLLGGGAQGLGGIAA